MKVLIFAKPLLVLRPSGAELDDEDVVAGRGLPRHAAGRYGSDEVAQDHGAAKKAPSTNAWRWRWRSRRTAISSDWRASPAGFEPA